jgi:hypothetical protein
VLCFAQALGKPVEEVPVPGSMFIREGTKNVINITWFPYGTKCVSRLPYLIPFAQPETDLLEETDVALAPFDDRRFHLIRKLNVEKGLPEINNGNH